jgi:hypothetical protein
VNTVPNEVPEVAKERVSKVCALWTGIYRSTSATGWTIGVILFDSRRGLGIFLFTTASRAAPGPTQPPIQWVSGALSLGVKRPGRETGHSLPSSVEVKEGVELYLHFPDKPSWCGAQLKHRDNFAFYLAFCYCIWWFPEIYSTEHKFQLTVLLEKHILCILSNILKILTTV